MIIFIHRNMEQVANNEKRQENLTNLTKEVHTKQYYHISQHKYTKIC